MDLSPKTIAALRGQLRTSSPLMPVSFTAVIKARRAPASLSFGPDLCLLSEDRKQCHLIYALGTGELPSWVVKARGELSRFKGTRVTVIAVHTPSTVGYKNANKVAEKCIDLGYGLSVESGDGCFPVFPPLYQLPNTCPPIKETGHVPEWIRTELLRATNLSPYLLKAISRLNRAYEREAQAGHLSYEDECQLLMDFAHEVRRGDTRLFFPVGQLTVLKEFENAGGNPGARDHFFHTFNNLFIGLSILDKLAAGRRQNIVPDRYIAPGAGEPQPQLKLWESLWALTCFFHDPGYIGEHYWPTYAVALGANAKLEGDIVIPDAIVARINNVWDSDLLEARQCLIELFKRVAGIWQLPGFDNANPGIQFDPALRRAYFDGQKCGHSLISGLNLIKLCKVNRGQPAQNFDQEKALKACVIAALSMMFHDPHARHTLVTNGVPAISFEDLPYAATLMFADALQDDRRDIAVSAFPTKGVLDGSVVITSSRVTATVCLPRIPAKWWAGKIVEYENVMNWINRVSSTRFIVDYRSRMNL